MIGIIPQLKTGFCFTAIGKKNLWTKLFVQLSLFIDHKRILRLYTLNTDIRSDAPMMARPRCV